MSLRIRKGDKVVVLAGKDKGKTGKVVHVYPDSRRGGQAGRALVQGINMVKKHVRKNREHPQGAILTKEMPIHLSSLGLVCPVTGKPTRVKIAVASDGSKQRLSAKNKAVIA